MNDNEKMKSVSKLRSKIDKIDNKIMELLAERNEISESIIDFKQEMSLPLSDSGRENSIIDRLYEDYKHIYSKEFIESLFLQIFHSAKIGKTDTEEVILKLKTSLAKGPLMIAGPCVIESQEQITRIAKELSEIGVSFLRGGAYKPRTSPDSFQGMGREGLDYLKQAATNFGMITVSEIMDTDRLEAHYDRVDIIQIGSRNMASYGLLKRIGRRTAVDQKPVLLKRGFSATLSELLYAAEYIKNEGNPNVMLCLRGIRTFEQKDSELRNTPDLASILELKHKTDLPVIFDPSHSSGDSSYVEDLSKAALELGADGLMIETHYEPEKSKSDEKQAVKSELIKNILNFIKKYETE